MATERSKRYPTREAALAACIESILGEPPFEYVEQARVWQFHKGATTDDRNRWTWMYRVRREVNDFSNARPQDRQKLIAELLAPPAPHPHTEEPVEP